MRFSGDARIESNKLLLILLVNHKRSRNMNMNLKSNKYKGESRNNYNLF